MKRDNETKINTFAFNSVILHELANNLILEKKSTDKIFCKECVFLEDCPQNQHVCCMAKNRKNKDSVYYVRNKKK